MPTTLHPARKVPISIKNKLKAELDKMEKQGIMIPTTEPTKWVHSQENQDTSDLNKAILSEHYKLLTAVKKNLQKKLKMKNAKYTLNKYWPIPIIKASSYLLTLKLTIWKIQIFKTSIGNTQCQ